MKKRIEEDDVIYTIDKNSGDCIDIDVKPGVEEVSFNASFGREYLLGDCKKVFPDIRKIVIDYSVYDIDIPNTLFPNVKEVECSSWYGKYIKSGSLLLRNDNGQILTNVFGKKEGETIDLKYVTKIDDDAFSGCMATKIINSGSVTSCAEYAFRNSAIGDLEPEPAGAVIAGSILVNIDETSENIILPDKRVSLTAMRDGINFDNVKSITANRVQTVINLRYKLPVGVKIILKDKSYITDEQLSGWSPFPILELTEENPYYSTKDGCLLSKDGLVLVKYPSAISGTVHIPDSTLEAAIKMPNVFNGKASVGTYIFVFKVNRPHEVDDVVTFIDFTEDGYTRQNRKKSTQEVNLKDTDHAEDRYDEVLALATGKMPKTHYYTEENGKVIKDTITLNGDDWCIDSHRKLDVNASEADLKNKISDYLTYKTNKIMQKESK